MRVTSKLARIDYNGETNWIFYCPGCKRSHSYIVPRWTFNGDVNSPTFTPSLRLFLPAYVDEVSGNIPEKTVCHLFITKGNIQYCGDCEHELAGQTVPMVDIPENYGGVD